MSVNIHDQVKRLNQEITTSPQGWLYENQGFLQIATGFFHKFYICIWDILTCGSTTLKTHNAIVKMMADFETHIQTSATREANDSTFAPTIHRLQDLETLRTNVKTIRLIWNKALSPLPASSLTKDSGPWKAFEQTLNAQLSSLGLLNLKLEKILPSQEYKSLLQRQVLLQTNQRELLDCQDSAALPQKWIAYVQSLLLYKATSSGKIPQDSQQFVDLDATQLFPQYKNWSYRTGHWNVFPKTITFETPTVNNSNLQKTLSYLHLRLDFKTLTQTWKLANQQAREAQKALLLSSLKDFILSIPTSQTCPISIEIPDWAHEGAWRTLTQQEQQEFKAFMQTVFNDFIEISSQNPRAFPHQTSLYEQVTSIGLNLLSLRTYIPGACFSRITGIGAFNLVNLLKKENNPASYSVIEADNLWTAENIQACQISIVALSLLPKEVDRLLKQLKNSSQILPRNNEPNGLDEEEEKEDPSASEHPTLNRERMDPHQLLRTYRNLANEESGTDFVLKFGGKELGVHRAVLSSVFGYCKALASFNKQQSGKENHNNILNLESSYKAVTTKNPKLSLSSDNEKEWLLNAIKMYAYTREHPYLPENSSAQAQNAYNVYLALIDYLAPINEDAAR